MAIYYYNIWRSVNIIFFYDINKKIEIFGGQLNIFHVLNVSYVTNNN